MEKDTAYAKDIAKAHFEGPQIHTDLLILWTKGRALNVHTLTCVFEHRYFHYKIETIQTAEGTHI